MNSLWVNIDQWGHMTWPTTHGMPDWSQFRRGALHPVYPVFCVRVVSQIPCWIPWIPTVTTSNHANHQHHQLSLLPVTHLSQSGAWLAATFAQKLAWEFHTLKVMLKMAGMRHFDNLCMGQQNSRLLTLGITQCGHLQSPGPTTTPLTRQTKNEQLHSSSKNEQLHSSSQKSGPEDHFSHGI